MIEIGRSKILIFKKITAQMIKYYAMKKCILQNMVYSRQYLNTDTP